MVIKDVKIFHSKGFQNVPKLGTWLENKPSGNPGDGCAPLFITLLMDDFLSKIWTKIRQKQVGGFASKKSFSAQKANNQ
jgi:hypothetical protein